MSDAPFQAARLLMEAGRYDLAEAKLRLAAAIEPENAAVHTSLSLCLAAQGKLAQAVDVARAAIRLNPQSDTAHYALGSALFYQGKLEPALAALKEALRLDPESAGYHGLLAFIYAKQLRWQEALDAARHGLEIDPQEKWCLNVRGVALSNLGRGKEASQTLEAALSDDPENWLTHANRGFVALRAGDSLRAQGHLREALRLNPSQAQLRWLWIKSIKSRFAPYRWLLRLILSDPSVAGRALLGLTLAVFFLPPYVRFVTNPAPDSLSAYWVGYSSLLLVVTAIWSINPLMNFLLQFAPVGGLILSRRERMAACCTVGLLASSLALIAGGWARGSPELIRCGAHAIMLTLPLNALFLCRTAGAAAFSLASVLALAVLAIASLSWPDNQPGSFDFMYPAGILGAWLLLTSVIRRQMYAARSS